MSTDKPRNRTLAVIYASMAAGPIAIAATLLMGEPITYAKNPDVAGVVAAAIWFSLIAAVFAAVPNLIGVVVMGWLSSNNVGLRHPAVWVLAGAAMAGVPTWLTVESDPSHFFMVFWTAIGASCALVCRAVVWWDDGSAAPPADDITPVRPRATP